MDGIWKEPDPSNKFLPRILKVVGLLSVFGLTPMTLFEALAYLWRNFALTSVSLENDYELSQSVLTWAVGRSNRWRHLQVISPQVHQFRKRRETSPIKYGLHSGTHIFWWGIRPFLLRVKSEMTSEGGKGREYVDVITVGSPQYLKHLVEHIKQWSIVRQKNITSIRCPERHGQGYRWILAYSKHSRPMETVVLGQEQKLAIINDIEVFLLDSSRRLYVSRGIPYRRGYLLHGPPGTGKSTLCYALAGHFGLDIYVISLARSELEDDHLEGLFRKLPDPCIAVLEDVDAGVLRRDDDATLDDEETYRERNGISLSGLLNTLDGIASSEGRVLIMTTNCPERLDGALTRPGRVDMKIEFTLATANQICDMFYNIYRNIEDVADSQDGDLVELNQGVNDVEHNLYNNKVKTMAKAFSGLVPEGKFSPAEIQGYLIKWKEPNLALDNAKSWVENFLKNKEAESEAVRIKGAAEETASGS